MPVKVTQKHRALLLIAKTQEGYFTAKQAQAAGYSRKHMGGRCRLGQWVAVDKGLYRLPEQPQTLIAEMLRWTLWSRDRSESPQGVISHETALRFYGLLPASPWAEPAAGELFGGRGGAQLVSFGLRAASTVDSPRTESPAAIHLTVPLAFRKKPPTACRLHFADLTPAEWDYCGGCRITVLERTLADTRAWLEPRDLWGTVLEETERRGLRTRAQLHAAGFIPSQRRQVMPSKRAFGPVVRARQAGFTLVELLVVMAIISVLAGMLLPVLKKAQDAAYAISCLNNLKQWGLVTGAYCDNAAEFFWPHFNTSPYAPGTLAWNHYGNFVRTLYVPDVSQATWLKGESINGCFSKTQRIEHGTYTFRHWSYGVNYHLACPTGVADCPPARRATLKNPAGIIWLTDVAGGAVANDYYVGYFYSQSDERRGLPHNQAANTLYVDGHCAAERRLDSANMIP